MSQIIVEFDNTLEKSEIIVPLLSSSKEEAGDKYTDTNMTDKAQTKVFGIQSPLISINNTVIDFDAVQYFSLSSTGKLPELTMAVVDKYELINNVDKPGNDNEIRVQILPKFDNTYKKINLTFFISSIKVDGSLISLSGSYKVPDLTSSRFESFGEVDTYNLFKEIGTLSKLGFASNIAGTNDKRYVYCNNKSFLDILNDEIQFSNTEDHILDYWIDYWDNINLVDIRERYTTVDSDEDIMIWVAGQVNEVTAEAETTPARVPASINDHPGFKNSELFVKEYVINNNPGASVSKGSDKVYAIYEEDKDEYLDHLLQDGDIKKDIFTKYEYLGECYGGYNYILSKAIRSGFLQKFKTDTIKVTINAPNLGIFRGHKVNFIRYVNDSKVESKLKALEEHKIIDRNVASNISLTDYEITEDSGAGKYEIDKSVSGQYLVTGTNIKFSNGTWDYELTLVRNAADVIPILNNLE